MSTFTHIVVEFTEITNSWSLDDSTSIPATSFGISSACPIKDWSRTACTTLSTTEIPSTGFDWVVISATSSFIDVIPVRSKISHIIWEWFDVVPSSLCWTPWRSIVPLWSLWYFRLRSTEHLCRSTVPYCLCMSTLFHGVILIACHLASCYFIVSCGAFVVLIRLSTLATCIGCSIWRATEIVRDSWVTPVVFITCVVHDGLLHALA